MSFPAMIGSDYGVVVVFNLMFIKKNFHQNNLFFDEDTPEND